MDPKPQHIHIIGICGVATSALAIAFKNKGWKVTGSDKGFYPPVSTELAKANITFYAGWHPENLENNLPDIVMIGGNGKSSINPETLFFKEKSIPLFSYPEIIEKYFLRENSIVCAGTWGKTTSTTLLSYILDRAGYDPTYMFGGISLSQDTAARLTESKWSVLEGDEYTGSQTDNVAKFFHYHPTHLLLTSVSWDHADVYPTEELYFDAFRKLIAGLPPQALVVACTDDKGVNTIFSSLHPDRVISYGKNETALYRYSDVTHSQDGLKFTLTHTNTTYTIESPLLGRFNVENITACFAMAHEVGIAPEKIIFYIKDFQGIKRRLEKRYTGKVTVLDCHAPTPAKATFVIESIREIFKGKIIAIYEPNIGGRQRESMAMYDHAFNLAHELIIPRLSKLKKDENAPDEHIEGNELTQYISKTHKGVYYIPEDDRLITHLILTAQEGDVIAFLGSHGFRGMIEETVVKLQEAKK